MHMQAAQHIQKLNPVDRRLKVLDKYVLNAESIFTIICWKKTRGAGCTQARHETTKKGDGITELSRRTCIRLN